MAETDGTEIIVGVDPAEPTGDKAVVVVVDNEGGFVEAKLPTLAERRSIRNRNLFSHVVAGVMANLGAAKKVRYSTAKKYDPCPCGSGKKFKFCCMK